VDEIPDYLVQVCGAINEKRRLSPFPRSIEDVRKKDKVQHWIIKNLHRNCSTLFFNFSGKSVVKPSEYKADDEAQYRSLNHPCDYSSNAQREEHVPFLHLFHGSHIDADVSEDADEEHYKGGNYRSSKPERLCVNFSAIFSPFMD
jgi:hypothetical protein